MRMMQSFRVFCKLMNVEGLCAHLKFLQGFAVPFFMIAEERLNRCEGGGHCSRGVGKLWIFATGTHHSL